MTTLRLGVSIKNFCLLACSMLPLGVGGCTGFITGGGANDETGDGDGDDTGDTGEDGVSIYAIQRGEIAEGTLVTIKGVVVTSPVNADKGLAFVQEPGAGEYSGISLYLWSEVVTGVPLKAGDVVDITGEYAEFFGVSQIVVKNVGNISVVGSAAVPGPDLVSAAEIARTNPAAEPWEGVRVQLVNPTIAETNDGFGQYVVEGDALIGNAFVDPLPQVQLEGSFASITGPLHYSFNEFKLMPASAADLAGYQGPPAPADPTSIYAIQQGTISEGTFVKLDDVVATSGFTWSNSPETAFFVQEVASGPFSGIQVFLANKAGLTIEPGDRLTVVGTYKEFFGMSQIEVSSASNVTKLGSGPTLAPELIADPADIATGGALAEDYEGVLVQVEDVVVTDENPDAPDEFGEFVVTGDLRINDVFFAISDWTKPALGASYASITGPLVFSFSNFKLSPRDAADLVGN